MNQIAKNISEIKEKSNILEEAVDNLNRSEIIQTKSCQKSNIEISSQKIEIQVSKKSKSRKKNITNSNYKNSIKNIAKKLKKRVKFPKCKIFKFYLSYRLLILRIAKGIKKTAKHLKFWEKKEDSITEQEIKQIQEIASTACKIIQEEKNRKKDPLYKYYSSSSKKNKNQIKIGPSLFRKSFEKQLRTIKTDNDDKSEIEKKIFYLKNLSTNEGNINFFLKEFTNFLQKNNIGIIKDTYLPNIKDKNNIDLLSQIDFWIKYIIFISKKYEKDLSLYNYINFIEQFYIWNNYDTFNTFNSEIKKQILILFNSDVIDGFLLKNKISNLDELFERYKNIHTNYKYKELKINNVECQCLTCSNKGYINKIINYNKVNNKISLSKENNLSYIKKENTEGEEKKNKKDNKNKRSSSSHENAKLENKDDYIDKEEKNEKLDKYYDVDVFYYLKKIEKGKKDDKEIETRNKNDSNKKRRNSNKKNRNKSSRNDKIQEIFDLLSVDGDLENIETKENVNSSSKKNKRNNSKKNNRKKHYP